MGYSPNSRSVEPVPELFPDAEVTPSLNWSAYAAMRQVPGSAPVMRSQMPSNGSELPK
ncbi:hypothetical protein [Kibdelosporangium aridum]|nr:hypothetical protein [Kibdelosporangium aridum]